MHNVIIKKPCTKGYEEYDSVMLQAHMDMVCEATQGTDFDFLVQPISTYVDGEGNLRAYSTTLGADDGMGVAEMLAILEDSTLQHPELECAVFTQVKGGMDIITCGPVAGNFHTPQEYLNLASWDRTYRLLVTILSKVSKQA